MCGICGVISEEQPAIEPAVRRMMNALLHRGPDDEGFEVFDMGTKEQGPFAGIGFRRLAILDLTTAGHQPMRSPVTGDCLIFNGEIYNYRRLRAELQCEGVLFRGQSDTEVLLHALSRWGDSAIHRLQGMFAFAFYEAKTRRVLLARDPQGIKPLYIAESTNQLVFASEVRALLASRLVGDQLDPAGIAGLLAYGATQDPLTMHRHVRSFPAGEARWYAFGEKALHTAKRRFWNFPDPLNRPTTLHVATEQLKQLLRDSVSSHLVSDRPAGVFLSAGIDSVSLAAIAKQLSGKIRTFTVGFDEPGVIDELVDSAEAAKLLGTDHHPIVLNSASITNQWEDWLAASDRPSIDGFNTFIVSRAVAAAGNTVALSGLGGDELFGGYPNFNTARYYRRLLLTLRPVPRVFRELGLRAAIWGRRPGFQQKAIDMLECGSSLPSITLRLRRILTDQQMSKLGLTPKTIGLDADFLAPEALPSAAVWPGLDDFNAISRMESVFYMGNTLLRDTDTVSMANSLEVRVPLLDQRIVDYVFSLSGDVKTKPGGPTKLLLRQAVRDLIPEKLANRPKTGFCLPIDRWMHGPLRAFCTAAIDAAADSGVLSPQAVRAIWSDFLASSHNVHWTRPMTLVALGAYLLNHSAAAP